ncbi:MAG: hypothetical protein D6739_03615, partial [Nitrospirae bacterium]
PDTSPPDLALLRPAAGATLEGRVTVEARATDASGVAWVALYVDGRRYATAESPPFTFLWDTTAEANGDHTLALRAEDAAGNAASTTPISVVVANPEAPAIDALSAAHALPKERLTLTGTGLGPETRVTIGGKRAPVVARTAGGLTVKVPRLPKYTRQPVVAANGDLRSEAATLEIR